MDFSGLGLFRANETKYWNKLNTLRISTGRRQISWLFPSAAEELNQGLPETNPARGQSGTWTRDLPLPPFRFHVASFSIPNPPQWGSRTYEDWKRGNENTRAKNEVMINFLGKGGTNNWKTFLNVPSLVTNILSLHEAWIFIKLEDDHVNLCYGGHWKLILTTWFTKPNKLCHFKQWTIYFVSVFPTVCYDFRQGKVKSDVKLYFWECFVLCASFIKNKGTSLRITR